jgi:hypothetical protein
MTATREEFTAEDFERHERRKHWNNKRKDGSIPSLTDEILDDPEWLRDWLTAALRPRPGWRVLDFTHGDDDDTPCMLELGNGQERAKYRWRTLGKLSASPERFDKSISATTSGQLRPPQLSKKEHGDVIRALCTLRPAIVAQSEPDQAKDWLFNVLDVTRSIEGHTLLDLAGQRDALAALKSYREFSFLDTVAICRRPEDPWPWQPACLIDRETGAMGLRPLEALTVLRHLHRIQPLHIRVLTYRWREIGVEYRHFDPGRQPGRRHLKGWLYLVPPNPRAA